MSAPPPFEPSGAMPRSDQQPSAAAPRSAQHEWWRVYDDAWAEWARSSSMEPVPRRALRDACAKVRFLSRGMFQDPNLFRRPVGNGPAWLVGPVHHVVPSGDQPTYEHDIFAAAILPSTAPTFAGMLVRERVRDDHVRPAGWEEFELEGTRFAEVFEVMLAPEQDRLPVVQVLDPEMLETLANQPYGWQVSSGWVVVWRRAGGNADRHGVVQTRARPDELEALVEFADVLVRRIESVAGS